MGTIYIDPSAPTNGTGTQASPFNAWSAVSWVSGNSYLQRAGTTALATVSVGAANVSLGSYGEGGKPIIDGGGARATGIAVAGYANVTIDGFSFANIITTAISVGAATGLVVKNCLIDGSTVPNTFSWSADGVSLEFCYNEVKNTASVAPVNIGKNGTYNIHNNLFHSFTQSILRLYAVKSGTIKFNDNTISSTAQPSESVLAIKTGTWSFEAKRNSISVLNAAFALPGIEVIGQVDTIIEGNVLYSTSTANWTPIKVTGVSGVTSSGLVIRSNRIYKNNVLGYGISVGTENTSSADNKIPGALIEKNAVYGPPWFGDTSSPSTWGLHGIFVGHSSNATIKKNFIYGAQYGVVVKGSSGTNAYSSGGVFSNITAFCLIGCHVKGVSGVLVYNNTFGLVSSGTGANPKGVWVIQNSGGVATGCKTKNNIVMPSSGGLAPYAICIEASCLSGFECDYNCAEVSSLTSAWSVDNSATALGFSAFKALGYEAHGLCADPIAYRIWDGDARLSPHSPCRGMGAALGVEDDYHSVPFRSPPNIGACEYVPGRYGSSRFCSDRFSIP